MRRIILVLSCLTAAFVFLWPIKYEVCPPWVVSVVDAAGAPIAAVPVKVSYEDYSVENVEHVKRILTDASGRALFSQETSRSSLAARGLGGVVAFLTRGFYHAGIGR
jgi:hypothetical protein